MELITTEANKIVDEMGTMMIQNSSLESTINVDEDGDDGEPEYVRLMFDHSCLGVLCGSYKRTVGRILWEDNSSNVTNAIQNVVRGCFFFVKALFFSTLRDVYSDRLPLEMFLKELVDQHILWFLLILSKNGNYEMALEEAISLHKVT